MLPAILVNKVSCGLQTITLQPPQAVHLWRLRVRKQRTLAPESWGARQRNDSSEPILLHLPIHRKVFAFLIWGVRFSLNNSNPLMLWLPDLCCKNSHISWLPLYLFGAVVPQNHLRGCVLDFPGGAGGKEPSCLCRSCGFDPWVGKVPWRGAW